MGPTEPFLSAGKLDGAWFCIGQLPTVARDQHMHALPLVEWGPKQDFQE